MVHPLLKMEMRVHFKSRVFCNLPFHSVDGIRYTVRREPSLEPLSPSLWRPLEIPTLGGDY